MSTLQLRLASETDPKRCLYEGEIYNLNDDEEADSLMHLQNGVSTDIAEGERLAEQLVGRFNVHEQLMNTLRLLLDEDDGPILSDGFEHPDTIEAVKLFKKIKEMCI